MPKRQAKPQADPVEQPEKEEPNDFSDPRFSKDDEFEKLFNRPTTEEREILEESIKNEGCREKLIVGVFTEGDEETRLLVDGYTRLAICRELDKDYHTHEIEFNSRDDAKMWMLENQYGRRNMSKFQRIEIALKFKEKFTKEGKERQKAGGGADRKKSSEPGKTTREQLAKMADVSFPTVKQVEYILGKVKNKTLLEKLRKGDISINAAYQRYKVLEKGVQSNSTKKNKPKDRLVLWRTSRPRKDTYKKDYSEIIASLDTFEKSLTQEEDRVKLWKSLYMYWLFDDKRLGADEEMKKLRDTIFDKGKKDSD